MRKYRTPAAYALAVLLLLVVVVLMTPNGTTHARWSATGQAEVPALTMGVIGFDVAGAGSSATLTNTSGFGVRYRPAQVSTEGSTGASVAPPAGLRFAYRTGTDCGDASAPARWTAAAPDGSADTLAVAEDAPAPLERDRPAGLCLTVSTDGVAEAALRPLAGRSLQVVTRLEAATLDGGSWSTARDWTVPFTVDLPPVTSPSAPVPANATGCGADKSAAVLRWTWTDQPGSPAVAEWQVLVRPAGSDRAPTWVKTVPDGGARTAQVSVAELLQPSGHRTSQDYDVLVRAVFAGGSTHADSPYAWRIKAPGNSGNINCEGLPS